MGKSYLITYDINSTPIKEGLTKAQRDANTRRNYIHTCIENKFKDSVELSESSYAIVTELSSDQIFDYLKANLKSHYDQLWVIPIVEPFAGEGDRDTEIWLNLYLTAC